jgi:hypothetical protein
MADFKFTSREKEEVYRLIILLNDHLQFIVLRLEEIAKAGTDRESQNGNGSVTGTQSEVETFNHNQPRRKAGFCWSLD